MLLHPVIQLHETPDPPALLLGAVEPHAADEGFVEGRAITSPLRPGMVLDSFYDTRSRAPGSPIELPARRTGSLRLEILEIEAYDRKVAELSRISYGRLRVKGEGLDRLATGMAAAATAPPGGCPAHLWSQRGFPGRVTSSLPLGPAVHFNGYDGYFGKVYLEDGVIAVPYAHAEIVHHPEPGRSTFIDMCVFTARAVQVVSDGSHHYHHCEAYHALEGLGQNRHRPWETAGIFASDPRVLLFEHSRITDERGDVTGVDERTRALHDFLADPTIRTDALWDHWLKQGWQGSA